jgi:tetratricopeptide (TPR) repeat protein
MAKGIGIYLGKKGRKILLISIVSLFFCLIILQIIFATGSGKAGLAKSEVAAKDEAEINMDSELKKIEILMKMGFENADMYYNRGWIYSKRGRDDLAKNDYTHALELDKNYADAYYNRGLIYMKEKRYPEAISDFTEAIKSDPGLSDALCNRGNAYLQTGQVEKALKDYNQAIAINDKDPDLFRNRAFIYRALGRFKDAEIDLKKAEEADLQ